MINYYCVVADKCLCVLGDALDPYTRRGVLEARHGHCDFLLQLHFNIVIVGNANNLF